MHWYTSMKQQPLAAITGVASGFIAGAGRLDALDMIAHVASAAAHDAGVPLHRVDGLFAGMQTEFLSTLAIGEYLGLRPRFSDNNRVGGSSFLAHVQQAALALEAHECDVVLICYASNQRSALGKLQTSVAANWSAVETPYKARFPVSSYALAAARHMHEYGPRGSTWRRSLSRRGSGRRRTPKPSRVTRSRWRTSLLRPWSPARWAASTAAS
jgi:acetyl-CoA acetyltransferase